MDLWSFVLGLASGMVLAVILAGVVSYRAERRQLQADAKEDQEFLDDLDEGDLISELVEQVNGLTEAFRALNEDVGALWSEAMETHADVMGAEEPEQDEVLLIRPGQAIDEATAQQLGLILKDHIEAKRQSATG